VTLRAHRSISAFVAKLDEEYPELGPAVDFHVANSLHTDFYEDWLDHTMVKKGAEAKVVREEDGEISLSLLWACAITLIAFS